MEYPFLPMFSFWVLSYIGVYLLHLYQNGKLRINSVRNQSTSLRNIPWETQALAFLAIPRSLYHAKRSFVQELSVLLRLVLYNKKQIYANILFYIHLDDNRWYWNQIYGGTRTLLFSVIFLWTVGCAFSVTWKTKRLRKKRWTLIIGRLVQCWCGVQNAHR